MTKNLTENQQKFMAVLFDEAGEMLFLLKNLQDTQIQQQLALS